MEKSFCKKCGSDTIRVSAYINGNLYRYEVCLNRRLMIFRELEKQHPNIGILQRFKSHFAKRVEKL